MEDVSRPPESPSVMAFFLAFAVLSAIAISSPIHATVVDGWLVVGACLCSLVAPALAIVVRRVVLRRLKNNPEQARQHLRLYVSAERLFPAIWFLGSVCCLFLFSWRSIVRFNWELDKSLLVDEVLLLAPLLIPWLLIWCVQYDIENWDSDLHPAARNLKRFRFVASQARLLLGIVIAPLLVVSSFWDLNQLLAPGIEDRPMGWVTMLVPLVGLFVAYPVLLRRLWPTKRLANEKLREKLEATTRQAGLSMNDILVWETPNEIPNAAMTGLLPSMRYVLLSQSLLDRFTDREIQATFAHELGHIRFHHNAIRMLAMLLPVVTLGLAANGIVQVSSWLGVDLSARIAAAPVALPTVAGLTLTVTYLVFAFGWFCRQLEHQADRFACRMLADFSIDERSIPGSIQVNATDRYKSAVIEYVSLLDRLGNGSDMDQGSWLHPSWNERKRFVQQLTTQRNSNIETSQFDNRLWRFTCAVTCTTTVGCLGCIYRAFCL